LWLGLGLVEHSARPSMVQEKEEVRLDCKTGRF
jgi:hypothetical protein